MKKCRQWLAGSLLALSVCVAGAGCGSDPEGRVPGGGATETLPPTVSVQTGALATDSWGYTGSVATQVAAPEQTEVLLAGRTLLLDPSRAVVTGSIPTRVSFSSDPTTLSAAARSTAPADFLCYLDLSMGAVRTALPALSVTVTAGAASTGQTVTVYRYEAGLWTLAATVPVGDAGKISFQADAPALWGVFR